MGRRIALSGLLASSTFAVTPAAAEWSAAAYLGAARTGDSSLRISQPALGTHLELAPVRFEGRSFDGPLYYGLRGGYFRGRVGVETEFIHLKVYARTGDQVTVRGFHRGGAIDRSARLDDIVQQYSISHGVNLLLLNLAARPWTAGRFALAGRFGAGPTFPHTESTIDGISQEQYERGRWALQLAAGAELRVWKGVHALAEYKATRTNQRGRVHLGHAEARLLTHHFVFGLGLRSRR